MREFLNAKTVVIASPAGEPEQDDRKGLLDFPERRDGDERGSA
jgi:hypothetical protein